MEKQTVVINNGNLMQLSVYNEPAAKFDMELVPIFQIRYITDGLILNGSTPKGLVEALIDHYNHTSYLLEITTIDLQNGRRIYVNDWKDRIAAGVEVAGGIAV